MIDVEVCVGTASVLDVCVGTPTGDDVLGPVGGVGVPKGDVDGAT